ncbi:3-phosphoshikimate 1-carboxyvinyltransferase [Subtercola endophyticus]|uniref:3-phosphoshikimate 1-carboxyvinyltransferase n=1 Tax=Subtercola endophyticus TaxID=2895559 RepID=UPI001E4571F8|nr:3-phosphoshikimate 1-carboxyvinyltransferase [Subtercola endophyticus]UFS60541.1 3-phosphoshikimate 1-carboxyvinyltransferase [Subtercola endophyticus]
MQLVVRGTTTTLAGVLDIPVSKYHAHRALVLASLAPGTSVISGISTTRQVEWTIGVLRALGTSIRVVGDDYIVTGGPYRATDVVDHGSRGADGLLNVGSSGTTLYFMVGLAALADRPMTLTGMKYFRRRPIKALLDSLGQMGVRLESDRDCPPITVQPVRPKGGEVSIAGTLSQWLSGLLLLAPFAENDTTIHVTGGALNEQPYVELTVRMMQLFGLEVEHSDDWLTYHVKANQQARPANYVIPPDIGSAAFGIAAAAIHPSDVVFRGLSALTSAETDHPEAEFLDLATAMGVPLTKDEATGFVRVQHDGIRLKPIDIDCQPIPDLLPVLASMATFADGTTRLHNVGHIRLKESDRVAAMLQLNRLGGHAEQQTDELRVTGVSKLHGAAMSSFNDHRVLMSLAVAASTATGMSSLTYPRAYRISYPTFLEAMNSIGLDIDVAAAPALDAVRADARETEAGFTRQQELAETGEAADQRPGTGGHQHVVQPSADSVEEERVPGIRSDLPLVLSDEVRRLATEAPDQIAVIEVGGEQPTETTWSELQAEADRVSALLLDIGVQPGESVAMQLPNWSEFVAITLGAIQIGAVATPIMPVFGPRETTMTLSRSRARVLFLPDKFRKRRPAAELLDAAEEARANRRPLALEHIVVLRADERHSADVANDVPPVPENAADALAASDWTWRFYDQALDSVTPDVDLILSRSPQPDDACQLLFTSGTTGEPKGVQHSHRTLAVATALHVQQSGLGADDRIYVPSPLAHQTGFLYGMLLAWRLNVAVIIQPVWNAQIALEQAFGQARGTFVQAAAAFVDDLVRAVKDGVAPAPAALRMFVATGSAVPRALAREARDVLGTSILGAFGTTETCLGTLAAPGDRPEDAWGSDGRALPGIRLRIVDDEGREMPRGIEGNYELHSPTMFSGYLDRPDLTADVFTPDHWYRTGDLAVLDEAGFLHITGRVKDVINRGGEKIPVVEIENLLYQHPLVADVAIVAMPDARLGERACAFVVPGRAANALTFGEMQAYLEKNGVSKYYWPERLEFIDGLPRNAVGKIQKNILRERASDLVAAAAPVAPNFGVAQNSKE